MKRAGVILCCLFFVGCLFWCFPLFRIVRTNRLGYSVGESAFNAGEFAKTFWNKQLIPSLEKAPEATTVLAAIQANPESARTKFGRKVGISRTTFIVMRGNGTVVKTDKNGVGVALQRDAKDADIVLQTGLLFGNTVRDATGLLDASTFSDSRQFNEISMALNRLIELSLIPALKEKAAAGRQISFAGCAEILDDASDIRPLTIIPLEISVE